MKFVELFNDDAEDCCVNVEHILSFSPYENGTYIKFRDGKTAFTKTPYNDFKELVK